ncbi:MAG: potassium transporter KefB [Deltaproteobacteria bacterium]|nr:MAG: potassium transporter KefB [Deltaproteobacteria bacterium]
MPDLSVLREIFTLLALALANAWLFSRLKQSPIVGYLVTGLLVGPYGFHLVKGVHEVEIVAEVGVILLLFTIGLEFSVSRILRLKEVLLKAGTVQLAATAVAVGLGTALLGEGWRSAAGLGMAMALSSTAIVLKLLLERGEIDSAHGRIALGILLFQDLCVIVFLVALPLLGSRPQSFSFWTVLHAALIMGTLYLFARHLLTPLLRGILRTRSPELFRLTILALVLGTAWATFEAGLSLALGAFLAGLALAESDSSHQVLSDIIPFRDVFLAVFFISVGMLVDIRLLLANWGQVLIGLLLLGLAKTVAGTLGALVCRYPLRTALITGLITFQVGEFSFILLKQAQMLDVLPQATYQLALSIVALSMMFTPLVFGRAEAIATTVSGWLGRPDRRNGEGERERTGNLEGHVIIASYGLSARNVARVLREFCIPYIHIEVNGDAVRRARMAGEIIMHGDASAPAVLEGAGIHRARALVLAINDPAAQARAIPAARELNPRLYILARTRYVAEIDDLLKAGADEVLPDELGAGLELATFLMQHCRANEGRLLKMLDEIRDEHHLRYRKPETQSGKLSSYLSVIGGGEIELQAVPQDSPHFGRTLAQLDFRAATGASVVGIIRHGRITYNPGPGTHLNHGDTLMLLGDEESIHKARELLHGHPV